MSTPAVSLETLREQIRVLEGGMRVQRRRVATGVEEVDALVGGFPCPGIVEMCGLPGSGRTRLAVRCAAAVTGRGVSVAWVDTLRRLHPPALFDQGVDLDRLLIVRPPADGTGSDVWATEQLLRSGCFALVIADLPSWEERGRVTVHRAAGYRWSRAAERGQCTAVALSERPIRSLPADVRLVTGQGALTVLRNRAHRCAGALHAPLPTVPEHAAPW